MGSPASVHIVTKESISLELLREGGLNNLELRGDMNLHISDPAFGRIKLALAPAPTFGAELHFKHHPSVGEFAANGDRLVALKDPSRSFPIGQPLTVLKWIYSGKDEEHVPLSINCWPTPSNDGTCDVKIEYELENKDITLSDVVISIPLPGGSYPTVSSHTGVWALNSSSHSLDWSTPLINTDDRSGSLEFSVGGEDPRAFFPVKASFVAQGSIAGVNVQSVTSVEDDELEFSEDATVSVDNYAVVY
ncbi:Mu homology domain-containing protein [Epithele typhae]|uniref:Mu homology domain-containing protein n=1 Tax=Epithele typhae TaxID=378194 RepID=UPI002007491B|nr:Mu homology domain-containing protein [Epithele typhae]KAH9932095.1 Mu homology domain-containing protein [Epithele typhae]